MKKKIKDCTIQEIYDFCQKYTCCDDCPLYIFDVSGDINCFNGIEVVYKNDVKIYELKCTGGLIK